MLPYHKSLSLNNCCIIILLECCYPSARCPSPDRRSLQATSLYLPCVRQEKENCKLEEVPAVVKRKRGWVGEEEGVHWPQKFREWWQTSRLRHHPLTTGCCTSRLLKQFVRGCCYQMPDRHFNCIQPSVSPGIGPLILWISSTGFFCAAAKHTQARTAHRQRSTRFPLRCRSKS